MRSRTINSLVLAALCCAFCLCGGSEFIKKSPNEIDKYLQENPDLPEGDKACLEDGRFEIGILKETVFFLLGEPGEKKIVKEKWAKQEHWIYRKGGKKTFIIEDNYVVGILETK